MKMSRLWDTPRLSRSGKKRKFPDFPDFPDFQQFRHGNTQKPGYPRTIKG